MKTKIVIGIMLLLVALSMGCTEQSSVVEEQYDDDEYLKFIQNYCNILGDDVEGISTCAGNNNYLGIQHFSEKLKDHSLTALNDIDKFKLSSKLRPFNNEFKLALEDSYKAGKYGESGGKNHNTDDILLATEYLTKSRIHLERAFELIPDNL